MADKKRTAVLTGKVKEFWDERGRLNDVVIKQSGLTTKRFFIIDNQA